ncbi:MAG: hypothetical protein ACE5FL_09075 [Myxococcota bacterium]
MGTVFDVVSEGIEQRTDLAKLEARGTVRLALKQAGIDADTISPDDMVVVLEKLMPRELDARGVRDAEELCKQLAASVAQFEDDEEAGAVTAPETVFARLARS